MEKPGSAQTIAEDRGGNRSLDQRIARRLLRAVGDPPVRIRLWDGTEISPVPGPRFTVHFRRRAALYRILAHPDLYFGEAYTAGDLEVEGDLAEFLALVYRSRHHGGDLLQSLAYRIISRPRSNDRSQARRNIHTHYDIGNEFYRLWLDREAMQYTCAYFPTAEASLEEAQVAKLDHVCRKLRLKPGDRVVEAGCGWGGLARHMARHYGVRVRAFNISTEQVSWAREEAARQGLEGRVEYVLDDYRNISGEYDAFVSVGMLEHVGHPYYPELGRVIDRVLTPNGRGLIHSIGRNRPMGPMNAWIEKHIFPGAYPPALSEMMDIFEPHDFSVLDVENLRLHYALTLRHWLERYEAHVDQVERMFDASFVRAWRLYLAGSIAAFDSGQLQLFQVVFARGEDNTIPWTRDHLYPSAARPEA